QIALPKLLQSPLPMMRAYLLLTLPQDGLGEAADKIVAMGTDPDRIVRAAWACRMSVFASVGGGTVALDALRKQGDAEKDPLVRQLIATLLEEWKSVTTPPATQPAAQQ